MLRATGGINFHPSLLHQTVPASISIADAPHRLLQLPVAHDASSLHEPCREHATATRLVRQVMTLPTRMIEADDYAQQLLLYIHLNPVCPRDKRRPVPADRRLELTRYPWSSHRAYCRKSAAAKVASWLCLEWLSYFGRSPVESRQEYNRRIQACFGRVAARPWSQLRGGIVLGSDMLWLRVRLGGERLSDLARGYGYRDGFGIHRVVQRLEAESGSNKTLAKRLAKLRRTADLS